MSLDLIPFKIDVADAKTFVDYYRSSHPDAVLDSVWMDAEVIQAILDQKDFTGIRIYLAKYKEGIGRVGTPQNPGDFPPDNETLILALTKENGNIHENQTDFMYDYGHPCPPDCNTGDVIVVPADRK